MNAPQAPRRTSPSGPQSTPKHTSIVSDLKPAASFSIQGRKDNNRGILTLSMFVLGRFVA